MNTARAKGAKRWLLSPEAVASGPPDPDSLNLSLAYYFTPETI
jgi:hypothetical protein